MEVEGEIVRESLEIKSPIMSQKVFSAGGQSINASQSYITSDWNSTPVIMSLQNA